ncbi:MAG: hypothetical protein C9356_19395 [Oleiphilus sp.]|nr:MAG: hypothetical protein C9356_19395 [Oleiphilus sp.]
MNTKSIDEALSYIRLKTEREGLRFFVDREGHFYASGYGGLGTTAFLPLTRNTELYAALKQLYLIGLLEAGEFKQIYEIGLKELAALYLGGKND